MKNGRTKKNGRMRTTSQMRILAWILALVLCVPWNSITIAQEADAPVSDAALTSDANTELANDAADGGEDSAQPEVSVISAGGTPIDVSTEEEIEQNGDVGTVFSPLSLMGPYTVSFYQQDPEGENVPENNLIEEYTGVEYNTKLGVQIKKLQSEHPEYAGVKWSEKAGRKVTNNIALYASGGVAKIGGTTYSSLTDALKEVGNGETIELLDDVKENVLIDKGNFTLDMGGYTVSPEKGNTTSIFTINGGTVTLKNGTITGANAESNGGGINVGTAANLTLEKVKIVNNRSASNGGGIYSEGTVTFREGCTVGNNTAENNGGGIYQKGASLTVKNGLTISGNHVDSDTGEGTAMYLSNSSGNAKAELNGVQFVGNYGSVSTIIASCGEVCFNKCSVTDNTVTANVNGFDHYIIEMTYAVECNQCTITGNTASGSTICVQRSGEVTFSGCRIEANTATGSDYAAGAIRLDGVYNFLLPDQIIRATLTDTVITGNTGVYSGGIVACTNSDGQTAKNIHLTVTGGAIYGNIAVNNYCANDLWIPGDISAVSIPAAAKMSDGGTLEGFSWNDSMGGFSIDDSLTQSTIAANLKNTWNNIEVFFLTAGPQKRYVASVGGTNYTTIAAALDNVTGDGDTVTLTAGESDHSGKTIAESVSVPDNKKVVIDMNGRTLRGKSDAALTIPAGTELTLNGSGTINVLGADSVSAIVNNGTLNVNSDVAVTKIMHQGEKLVVSGKTQIEEVSLAEGKVITAGEDLTFDALTIALDEETFNSLNDVDSEDELEVPLMEGTDIDDALAEKITIRDANGLVKIRKSEEGGTDRIVAYRLKLKGVYLDGVDGDDERMDTPGLTRKTPVKTFEVAKRILEEQNTTLEDDKKLDGIYIMNTVTVSDSEKWSLKDAMLMRDPLFTGDLVRVAPEGSLTLDGITVDGSREHVSASGVLVCVQAGGSLSVTEDTVLQNNANTGSDWGGAVLVYGNMDMRGGEIRDNSGISGGGVALMGSDANMVLASGTIKDNTATEGGGGISILSGAKLEMGGGLIEGNTALSGGGIMAGGLRSGSVGNGSESFSMTGGTVQGNTANSCGGGIYVQSHNKARITAGTISGNHSLGKADSDGRGVTYGGGGIYVNGGRTVDKKSFPDGILYLENPIITGNTASGFGGGYAGCETSTTDIFYKNGAAIYGNQALGVAGNHNMQIYSGYLVAQYNTEDFISEYMFDGTPYLWKNERGLPFSMEQIQGIKRNLSLYSDAKGPDSGSLVISGNTSTTNGGGVGSNGTVRIGERDDSTRIQVEKVWADGEDRYGLRPEEIGVWLQREENGVFVDASYLKLNAENHWSGAFTNFPEGYTYRVREEMPDGKEAFYSAAVSGSAQDGFVITNTLAGELNISKTTINDISPKDKGKEFTFTVELKKGDEPFTGSIPYEKVKTGDGSEIESKVLEFTSEDGGKKDLTLADGQKITLKEVPYDLTYTVTETQAAGYTVKVGGKGTNSATGQIVSGESGSPEFSTDVMFTNTYAVTETTARIEGTKVLTGRDWADSDKFEFELTETTQPEKDADGEGKEVPDALKESLTAEATKASQNFRFGPITYTVPATHTYKVAEKDTTIDGVTKDTAVYTVTVTVTDKEDGTLEAKVTSYERTAKDAEGKETTAPADSMTFTNTYKADSTIETVESTTETVESTSTTATVTGVKELTGREWTDTDAFTFELTETTQPSMDGNGNGTEIPDKLNGTRTATATKAAREFNFGTFEYTEPYVHTYEVRETSPSDKGITADSSVYTITVTVTDNGEGKLTASSTAAKNGAPADAVIFTNTYTAEGRAILSGTKLLTGGREEPMYDNEFHFILRENGNVIERVGNHADGSITFSELHYTLADVGEHVYEIAEDKESEKRVTYSERMFTVRVLVTDNLDGTLSTQVEYPEGGVTFENVYAPKKSEKTEEHIFGQLDVTKLLYASEGHPLIADDAKFYVALFSDEARTLRVSEVKELRYSDSAGETVTFEDLRLGATYYVGETDECGVLKGSGVIDNAAYLAEYPDGYAVKLTKSHSHGHVAIHNTFYEIPQGFYYGGELTITKKVQMGGKDYATDEVFYAGVFKDAALTKREGDVIALWMEGASKASQILPVHVGTSGTEKVTYYVAETDEHGNVLDPDSSLEFTISLNHKSVQMSVMDFRKKVVITNDFVEESTETETKEDETETENVPAGAETPKTGDGTPIGIYLLLLAVSFAVMLTVGLKRKERE